MIPLRALLPNLVAIDPPIPGRDVLLRGPRPPQRRRACRILRKAGFAEGLSFDEPQPDGTVTTMAGHILHVAQVIG